MENQATSIEQSQRLLELGVPAEKASMVWTTVDDNETVVERDLCLPDNIEGYAFTVADLMGILPYALNNGSKLHIEKYDVNMFDASYRNDDNAIYLHCSSYDLIGLLYAVLVSIALDGEKFNL